MTLEFMEIGTITGTHGVRGELRVHPACDSPDFFRGFAVLYFDPAGQRPVRVIQARAHKNMALLQLEGVESYEAAQALKNQPLFFRRSDVQLEEGRYFISELLGCEVYDANETGLHYGQLCDVSQPGANDVWHIRTAQGREVLIPVIDDVVKHVDIAAKRVEITMLPGLMDGD